ncbi:MAG: PilZ domain-containing protein [Desulfobacteraceae bacterium]|jgi:hypothetical protein
MAVNFLGNSTKRNYHFFGTGLTLTQRFSHKTNARLFKRVPCNASITYEYYDPENFSCVNAFNLGNAKLCNYSHGGMCLQLKQALKPDLPIFVRVDASGVIPALEKKHGHHVEVIWCKQLKSKKIGDFQIGVRFYESPMKSEKQYRRMRTTS